MEATSRPLKVCPLFLILEFNFAFGKRDVHGVAQPFTPNLNVCEVQIMRVCLDSGLTRLHDCARSDTTLPATTLPATRLDGAAQAARAVRFSSANECR
jgi:hypothetical protein